MVKVVQVYEPYFVLERCKSSVNIRYILIQQFLSVFFQDFVTREHVSVFVKHN